MQYSDIKGHQKPTDFLRKSEVNCELALGEFKWEIEQPIAAATPVP